MTSPVNTNSVVSRRFSCHIRQRWFNARHTCSRVISGFSPPEPIRVFGDKSHHYQAQDHVPHQRHIAAALEVTKTNFGLRYPKRMFDVPTTKRHTQQTLHRSVRRRVRDEILPLPRRHVASHDQPIRAVRQFTTAHQINLSGPYFPFLIVQSQPCQRHAVPVTPIPRRTKARQVIRAFSFPTFLGLFPTRPPRQTTEITRYFANIVHTRSAIESRQNPRVAAVVFIEGQPVQTESVGLGSVQLLQGDPPFGAIHHLVGNGRRLTPRAIIAPAFRQEQLGIDQRLEEAANDGQMDSDNAVLDLAEQTTPLPLYPRRFSSFLGDGSFINDAYGAEVASGIRWWLLRQALLQLIPHAQMRPHVVAQKLLKRPDRSAAGQSHRLNTLAFQVRDQASTIRLKMFLGPFLGEAIMEQTQVSGKRRTEDHHLFWCHMQPP